MDGLVRRAEVSKIAERASIAVASRTGRFAHFRVVPPQGQPGARDPRVPGTTEQRARRHPQPPSHAARFARRRDTLVKRLAWQAGIGLGLLLLGFLAGTRIESRKENDHLGLTSVIRSLPYSLQAPALLQSHGGGVGITSDGGQIVLSCGDLSEPWISNDHKHAVISLR